MRTLFSSVLQIEEGAPNGSPVIKVHAVDKDKGVNGQVRYSIVQQPNQKGTKFNVDEETGELLEYRHLIKNPKYKKDWDIHLVME